MADCRKTMDFINERDRICNSYNDCNKCPFTEKECKILFGETMEINNNQYEKVIDKLQNLSDGNLIEKEKCDNSCNNSCENSECKCKQEDTEDTLETDKEVNKHEYSFDINVYDTNVHDFSSESEYLVGEINVSVGKDENVLKAFEATLDVAFKTMPISEEDMYIEVLFYCDGNIIEEFNNEDDSYDNMIDMIKYHIEKGTTKLGEDTAEFDEDYQRLEEERKKKIYEDFNTPNVKTPLAKLCYLHMKQAEILVPFLKEIVEKYGKDNDEIKSTCLKLAVLGEEMCVQLSNATKEAMETKKNLIQTKFHK